MGGQGIRFILTRKLSHWSDSDVHPGDLIS